MSNSKKKHKSLDVSKSKKTRTQKEKSISKELEKEELFLEKMMKNIVGAVIVMVFIVFFIPWLISNQQSKDADLIERLESFEVLIEIRLISILSNQASIPKDKLDEMKEIAREMDKSYRKLNKFNQDKKDYYGFYTGTINEYLRVMDEYVKTKNSELLEEAENVLFNFYQYEMKEKSYTEEELEEIVNLFKKQER